MTISPFPKLKAQSSCCGEDTTDKYDPDLCRVELSGGDNLEQDSPVCPGDQLRFSAETVCKGDDCADGIDWTYPAGLEKKGGGDGSKTLSLQNNLGDRPVGGSITASVNRKDVSDGVESDCQNCISETVDLGSAIRKGSYKVENDVNDSSVQHFGTDAVDLQAGTFAFDLRNISDEGFLKNASHSAISSIYISKIHVSVQGNGSKFPWFKGLKNARSSTPTIRSVSISNRDPIQVDDNLDDLNPVTSKTLEPFYEINFDEGDSYPKFLQVDIRSPINRVEVSASVEMWVQYQNRCGKNDGYSFNKNFQRTGKYKGLEISRVPQYIFADAEYWAPIKLHLPAPSDWPFDLDDSKIRDITVAIQQEDRGNDGFGVDNIASEKISKPGEDDLDEVGNHLIKWGFGDGTTSSGSLNLNHQWGLKERTMTVFVNISQLMQGHHLGKISGEHVHLANSKNEVKLPHFQIVVNIDGWKFASLDLKSGRPQDQNGEMGVFADGSVGPVLEPGQPTSENNVRYPKHNKYEGSLDYEKATVKHKDSGVQDCGNDLDLETKISETDAKSETINLSDFPEYQTYLKFVFNDCIEGERDNPIQYLGKAEAKASTNNGVRLDANIYDVTGTHGGERAMARSTVTT